MIRSDATVEVRPAYAWDCNECGHENYERAIVYEFSPEELADTTGELSPEGAVTGEWISHPDEVKCRACGREYTVIDMNQEQD